MSMFEPELGQALFSNSPWEGHHTPYEVTAGIDALATIVQTMRGDDGPLTANYGAAPFDNGTFQLRSYCWCDGDGDHEDGCPPNFKCGNFEAHWYKHSGRGESCNRAITADEWRPMFMRCVGSLVVPSSRTEARDA